MATRVTGTVEERQDTRKVALIDCDVHVEPPGIESLLEYMEEPWRSRAMPRVTGGKPTYRHMGDGHRSDSRPSAGTAGSDPDLVGQQVFVDTRTDFALMLPITGGFTLDHELNAVFANAMNRWVAETWLDEYNDEGRYFGAITVSVDDADTAVREIEHWAGHPGFRQVLVGHHGDSPFGHRRYEPIWAAAARHGLPVAMHFRRDGGENFGITPTGHYQHYVDYHSLAYPAAYAAHLVSWICSGVFDRIPELRFVMVEGGFLWHRPIVNRLEQHWARTSAEFDRPVRRPLDYIREHVRWTSQPIEEAERPADVAALLEAAEADRLLLFSSDYPHYDYDHPARAFPPQLSETTLRRVMHENAQELYGLPATRPVDRYDLAAEAP